MSTRGPRPASVLATRLDRVFRRVQPSDGGSVADYIPELAKADPNQFGIALATADGHVYDVGDADREFTIQSISKPFLYGLALEDRGPAEVLTRIGVEPSGDAFNSIVMDERNNRPLNPMVNAGAIACTSLVRGDSHRERLDHLLEVFSTWAGRPLRVDQDVFASERATGNRNRAIAYLELSSGMITEPVEEHLDLYFAQCAILVTARDLALMAATLANGGVNPRTGRRAAAPETVRRVLTVMATCGMYDWSGEWMYRVGIPAKSGVAGGILAVLPGQLGVGTFSPQLDSFGNSTRGVAVCEELAEEFGLHLLEVNWAASTIVRRRYDAAEVPSKRLRPLAERRHLAAAGRGVHVYELQGDLYFATAEQLIRQVEASSSWAAHIVLDARRVERASASALGLLADLHRRMSSCGAHVMYSSWSDTLRAMLVATGAEAEEAAPLATDFWPDTDDALEHCEDQLLAAGGTGTDPATELTADQLDILRDLDPADLALLEPLLATVHYADGETIVHEGDVAEDVFFLAAGNATARLAGPVEVGSGGAPVRGRRLRTFGPGVAFGETALYEQARRTADVVADGPATCRVLNVAALTKLAEAHPQVHARILIGTGQNLSRLLLRASAQIRSLDA
ncbi:MAG: glutaminase A [Sporichthyaceae bacterium]